MPAQQGIVFDLSIEALAIGTSAAKNDIATKRHKKRKKRSQIFLCVFVII
ncbi:MAG TPA: hypothetical protein VM656_16405 [Pyrinomonadaceae bacterium]|nr:hypothetical protein [Pyrinomonadaceae bacterium]